MTTKQMFEALPPEIVSDYLKTRKSEGIPEKVQRFIEAIDKVPEQHRRYPSVSRCCRELMKLYPDEFTSFRYAQEIVYASIQYHHLNNNVSNAAWDNYFADKQEELANIAVMAGKLDVASLCFERARRYRTNKDDNAFDAAKLRPHTNVLSPDVPPILLGLIDENGKEPSLNDVFKRKEKVLDEAVKMIRKMDVSDEEKNRLIYEAKMNLNMPEDIDFEDIPNN